MGNYTPGGFFGLCGGNSADVHDPSKAPQDIPKDANKSEKTTTVDASPASKGNGNLTESAVKEDRPASEHSRGSVNDERKDSPEKAVGRIDSMMYSDDEKKNDSDGDPFQSDDGKPVQSNQRSLRRTNQPKNGFSAPKARQVYLIYIIEIII